MGKFFDVAKNIFSFEKGKAKGKGKLWCRTSWFFIDGTVGLVDIGIYQLLVGIVADIGG